ncbi:hypothetical protein GCM10027064_15400 [Microbacterium petrolearium]
MTTTTLITAPVPGVRHVSNAATAWMLAEEILARRTKPLVVISTEPGTLTIRFDAARIADALGDRAEVVTIETGPVSMAMQDRLPPKCQVFNGAARVYAPDFWVDPVWQRSTLRFAGVAHDEDLIRDADEAGGTGVAFTSSPEPVKASTRATATVLQVYGDGSLATGRLDDDRNVMIRGDRLPAELSVGLAVRPGDRVTGDLSPDGLELQLDPAPIDLESAFPDGAVASGYVEKTTAARAYVALHPSHVFALRRRDITDETDETPINELVATGTFLPVRVGRLDGKITLTAVGIPADAEVTPSVPLVPGTPGWLEPERFAPSIVPTADPSADTAVTRVSDGATPPASPDAPRDSPAAASDLAPRVEMLEAELGVLRKAIARLTPGVVAASQIQHLEQQLRDEARENIELASKLAAEREARKDAIKAAQVARKSSVGTAPSREYRRNRWITDEEWIRHEIYLAWIDRIDPNERPSTPLGDYLIGERFASSLESLDDAQLDKAMRAVVDVVTGRAHAVNGRDLHPWRSGTGGDDPQRIRDVDGAKGWRCAIEKNSPSARRLHYWVLRIGTAGGQVELSRVVLHDDFAE